MRRRVASVDLNLRLVLPTHSLTSLDPEEDAGALHVSPPGVGCKPVRVRHIRGLVHSTERGWLRLGAQLRVGRGGAGWGRGRVEAADVIPPRSVRADVSWIVLHMSETFWIVSRRKAALDLRAFISRGASTDACAGKKGAPPERWAGCDTEGGGGDGSRTRVAMVRGGRGGTCIPL